MKKEFEEIWKLALPYQDKRDDKGGHARIVTEYALRLCGIEDVDDRVVIPAAVLHDTGWSKLSREERFIIFDPELNPAIERDIRLKHQQEGVIIARRILQHLNYPAVLLKHITEIISQHDTRIGFFSEEDGAVRDSDKLWRYSKIGFRADIRRTKVAVDLLYDKMLEKIDEEDFFFFESARNIARREIAERKKEYRL